MKNEFTVILGVALLSLLGQHAFTQTVPPVQVLGPAQGFPTPMSQEQIMMNGMQPIQNAVNTYGQRQFDMTMQLQQQAFAEQQQRLQLQAEAAAQQRQLQAQEETSYPATTIPNAFSQFYQDKVGASITNLSPYSGNTKIFSTSNTINDIKNLQRDNYWLIGVSAFQGPPQSQDAVMVQAKKVGADAVLLSSAYLGSQQFVVERYKYEAGFFRRMKPPVLGIFGLPLPSEIRQQLERNTGVLVGIVINDSPAFNANILEGDLILKMNGEDVMSVTDLNKKKATFSGQKVDVEIWRNGQFKTISVQLNNAQLGPTPALHNNTESAKVESAAKAEIEQFEIIKAEAENGNAEAQDKLGICYEFGKGVAKNEVEAAKWFRKAADQGNAAAQRFQGIYYLGGSGDGTPNYVEAAKWFRKAADQNDSFAEVCLGDLYADGNGVPQDYPVALKWYRKAADQGYALAQYNLGCYYYNGKGVPKDDVEAAKWFRKAADQGNAAAQFSLGYCLCKGEGGETNVVKGYKWCNLASAQGNESAKKVLSILEQKMTPEQIAEGQRLACEFQPHKE